MWRNYHKVRVVEAVDDVPAQLLELFTLEENRVEEHQGEQQLLVFGLCLAQFELGLGYQAVKPFHVCLQTFRRLGGHLYARLQDRYGKLGSRARAKPQSAIGSAALSLSTHVTLTIKRKPELRVYGFTGRQRFHDLVQFRHPAERQVAIREEHPGTFLRTYLYHSGN